MKNKIEFFKDREVDLENTRVFTYFNPNKSLFSVKALEGKHKGKIIIQAPALTLKGALFIVNEEKKQRSITDKKNIHSGIAGYILSLKSDKDKVNSWQEIIFKSEKAEEFTYKDKEMSIHFSNQIHLEDGRIFCNN